MRSHVMSTDDMRSAFDIAFTFSALEIAA